MRSAARHTAAELLQLLPILVFAARFVVAGELDLAEAHGQFLAAAALAVPLKLGLIAARWPLNPILLGVDLWLVLGVVAFELPLPSLGAAYDALGPCSLFLAIAAVGLFGLPTRTGLLGPPVPEDVQATRRARLLLLLLGLGALLWSWYFRDDIRIGGGLPFIALNISRRALKRRLASALSR